jgi:hypothetical protein
VSRRLAVRLEMVSNALKLLAQMAFRLLAGAPFIADANHLEQTLQESRTQGSTQYERKDVI